VSFGQIADLFLVFARSEEGPTAFLVPWDTEGLTIRPSPLTLGLRAAMLADLDLQGCRVPRENLVGRAGFGLSHVAASALDLGRYAVAWAALGIAEAAFAASVEHASSRRQRGVLLGDHQLVRRRIADSVTLLDAARFFCLRAAFRRQSREPQAIADTLSAKYFVSRAARQIADHAVQIHGAEGLSDEHPVQRYFRDARVMEIIEGSSEVLEILIAEHALADHRAAAGGPESR
jgi:alkylation response protein AidB-like acyl-CoA dehydrogenase